MNIKTVAFSTANYSTQKRFLKPYQLSLKEISDAHGGKGYTHEGYCFILLEKLLSYSRHERQFFLEYQLSVCPEPMRWLLDLEKLVSINSWDSEHGFFNPYAGLYGEMEDALSHLFGELRSGALVPYSQASVSGERDLGNEKFMDTEEAAAYLKISKDSLYQLTSKKRIPYSKPFGGKNYFSREDLDAFLSSQREEGSDLMMVDVDRYISRK